VVVGGSVGPAALRLAGGVFAEVVSGEGVPAAWEGIPVVDVRLGAEGADSSRWYFLGKR